MRSFHWIACAGLVAAAGVEAAPEAPSPTTLVVAAAGSIPGVRDAGLSALLAARMNAAQPDGKHFVPVPAGTTPSGDYVLWTFKPNPYAGGTIRRIGPPSLDTLFGVHRYLSVELRLFDDGVYQRLVSGEVRMQGGADDPDLSANIAKLTHLLLDVDP